LLPLRKNDCLREPASRSILAGLKTALWEISSFIVNLLEPTRNLGSFAIAWGSRKTSSPM
jgi:hypothetical protein